MRIALIVLTLSAGSMYPAQKCVSCHSNHVSGYARTGMGRSLGTPVDQPGGRVQHRRLRLEIKSGPLGLRHMFEDRGLSADYLVDYFIGSGNQGRSYLINIGGRLFQSPASWYSDRRAWGISPGFERENELDVDRPVGDDCLFCHSGQSRQRPFTTNTYETPAFGAEAITCERCHGSSERHVADPRSGNIINPAKLPADLRDAVCDQCHLGGEARILNPGRQFWDYKPGSPLSDVFSVYVFDTSRAGPLKVVSHSEQLAASRCAQQSGDRLWCGTCHDPHNKPAQPAVWYREKCRECHKSSSLREHVKAGDDCVTCHMPRRRTYDGGHTAFTDHQILARPRGNDRSPAVPSTLKPWHKPPRLVAKRNLGLAYISVGERHESAAHMNEGFRYLTEIAGQFADDTTVLTSIGAVLQKKQRPVEAARLFARAADLEPRDARHRLNLAVALFASGNSEGAVKAAEAAIKVDVSLRDAYLLLADIHAARERPDLAGETLRRYLQFMPQSLAVRRALLRLR